MLLCLQQVLSPSTGLLRPLPVPSQPWSHIGLDVVTGFPPLQGNDAILTIVDRFSKAVHFVPLSKRPTASETADLLVHRDYSHKIGKITFEESFGEFYGCRQNNTSTRTGKFSWELECFLCSQRNRITLLKSRRFLISLATAVVDMPLKFILWGGWISLKDVMAIHPISVRTFHSTNQPTLPSLQTEIPELFSLSLLFLIFLGRLENIMKQY